MIIVNGFQPLTTITKRSILHVAAALDLPLMTAAGNFTLRSCSQLWPCLLDNLCNRINISFHN